MLLLYLLIEPSDAKVPVELPLDATVGDLKAAVREVGGPPVAVQSLVIGAAEVDEDDATELSSTLLVCSEAVVCVRQRSRRQRKQLSCGRRHGLVILETGQVAGWGHEPSYSPMPDFSGQAVSVQAGLDVSGAIAGGRLSVWGSNAHRFDLTRVRDVDVVHCSFAVDVWLLSVVDATGMLTLHGPAAGNFLTAMRCPVLSSDVVAADCRATRLVVLFRDGTAALVHAGAPAPTPLALGQRRAVSVSTTCSHSVVLLTDGAVTCFGSTGAEQSVPKEATDASVCAVAARRSVACRRDGTLVSWGRELWPRLASAGPCCSVDLGLGFGAVVTADGRVVCDGGSWFGDSLLQPDITGARTV